MMDDLEKNWQKFQDRAVQLATVLERSGIPMDVDTALTFLILGSTFFAGFPKESDADILELIRKNINMSRERIQLILSDPNESAKFKRDVEALTKRANEQWAGWES